MTPPPQDLLPTLHRDGGSIISDQTKKINICMINLAIAGAFGRMGQTIIKLTAETEGVRVSAAIEHESSPALGQDGGISAGCASLGVLISSQVSPDEFDVMIDFTTPAATKTHIGICRKAGKPIMIGTTGMSEKDKQQASSAAQDIPVLIAANTSVGVNLCVSLVELASKVIGDVTDIEVIEAHHRHKVDAPSGTALLLGEAAARPQGKSLSAQGVFSRVGHTGERKSGSIGFSTIRGGGIVGEHTVMFIGEDERLEITHRATDRRIYALGALRAAIWLENQPPGLYGMQDVLGLR